MTEKVFVYELEGLKFEVTVYKDTDGLIKAKITVIEGYADFNAIYVADEDMTGTSEALKGPLNMNGAEGSTFEGEAVQWDSATKLSDPGLGKLGADKPTYLMEGETSAAFVLSGVTDIDDIDFLGIRATSTSTPEGSIKTISDPEVPPPPPDEDHFPEWNQPDISHVTFYFDTPVGFAGDTKGLPSGNGNQNNNPDGWFTVKFDVVDPSGNEINDLDNWYQEALDFIFDAYDGLSGTLKGVAIKGGQREIWYDFDNDPLDDDGVNAPSVFVVEGNEVDHDGNLVQTNDLTIQTDDFIFTFV